jgi:hypothetical protein
MSSSERPDQDRSSQEVDETEKQSPEQAGLAAPQESAPPPIGGYSSRWVQYETHELLEMITTLEDERRWARLREGVLWALLAHLALVLALVLLPKYVFKAPPVVEKGLHDKDFTYLDSPRWRPKAPPKPLLKQPTIDKQTLDEIRKENPPAAVHQPQPQPQVQPQQQAQTPAPQVQQTPQPAQQTQQGQMEAPHPSAVPKPNFAMGSQNPQDALRDAMRGAAKNRNQGGGGGGMGQGGLRMHPGAGAGGVEVLSDTQGVDFSAWLHAWHYETERTWDPLIPDEVNAPIYKSGMVAIRFKVLPNGRLMKDSVVLEGRSGDVALDRAAWGALTGSNYPSLPRDFHGPYLELRAFFMYNMEKR